VEIRNRSKAGPLVTPLAEITATLSHQIDDMKRRLLARLDRDLASFAQVEVGSPLSGVKRCTRALAGISASRGAAAKGSARGIRIVNRPLSPDVL
jgi:hypothetical protein